MGVQYATYFGASLVDMVGSVGKVFDLTFDNRFDLLEDQLENNLTLSEDIWKSSNVKRNEQE
jgi:hypothetical protein